MHQAYMYTLKTASGAPIDVDAIGAVMAGDRAGAWWLDTRTGTVEARPTGSDRVRIPRVTREKMERIMHAFITDGSSFVLDADDEAFVRTLQALLAREQVLERALALLHTNDAWMSAWVAWRDDAFWEDLVGWLASTVPGMTEAFELDCSCGMCHMLAEDIKRSGDQTQVDWNLDNLSMDS